MHLLQHLILTRCSSKDTERTRKAHLVNRKLCGCVFILMHLLGPSYLLSSLPCCSLENAGLDCDEQGKKNPPTKIIPLVVNLRELDLKWDIWSWGILTRPVAEWWSWRLSVVADLDRPGEERRGLICPVSLAPLLCGCWSCSFVSCRLHPPTIRQTIQLE